MRQLLVILLSVFLSFAGLSPAPAFATAPVLIADAAPMVAARRSKKKRRRKKRRPKKKKRKKKKKVKAKAKAAPVAEPAPAPKVAAEPEAEPAAAAETDAVEEEEERPGLAVMDMEVKAGFDEGVASMLNENMLGIINDSGVFGNVISGSDMRSMLDLEQQKAALGCEEDSCIAQLGGALGVPYMFSSSIGSFAGKFLLNVKIVAVDEAKVLARANAVLEDESALLSGLPDLVNEALEKGFGVVEEEEDDPEGEAVAEEGKIEEAKEGNAPKVVDGKAEQKDSMGARLSSPGFLVGTGLLLAGSVVAVPGVTINPTDDAMLDKLNQYQTAEDADSATTLGNEISSMIQMRQIAGPVGLLLVAGGGWIAGWNLFVGSP